MTPDPIARNRWLALVAIRIVTAMGAVFGLIVLARAPDTAMRVLGAAIVLSALYAMAVVPHGLTAKWRSK
ncbi:MULTISPECIES: hypothetical protein [unclassified Sphingomonas]|uniref:hypothetical protein n=1 Tax=unclassified Sphingomonas TaxID=196159 RepID=UPI0006F9A6F7|nr:MULTISPECIES: hypothetical protein [unclassified Sphingomonas]KQM62385.1 hypothetical protein ASE65_05195 [Sphingomonas sp. Leaf16]KQN13788.1 hypothetical protein ASE81_05265 [Sphingomonas sp. Leaf29]KQN22982.1 hypothetical protein ASE83_00145 [Sphingomonas sp. Leaf32]